MAGQHEPQDDTNDISDFLEGLDLTQVDGATIPEPVSEAPSATESVEGVDEPDQDPEDAEEPAEDHQDEDEPSEEEAPDDEDEDSDSEEELDPLEKRLRDQQAYHDRKMAEVQAQLEQMNQWAQQVYQSQLQQQQAQLAAQQQAQSQPQQHHLTAEQIQQGVKSDVVSTFKWVVGNAPNYVGSVIATARKEYGDEIGDQMQLEYSQYREQLLREEYQQQIEAQQQAQAEAQVPAQVEQVLTDLVDGIASQHGEAFIEVKDEFIGRVQETAGDFREYMNNQGLEMTPDAIHYFLTKTFTDIREERLNQLASKPRKPRKVTKSEHVETSTSGSRPEEVTSEQAAINEILQGAKALDIDVSVPTR